jgi:hypothetical protein
MKLLSTTLHYITRTNEDVGLFTEKIICDILKIPFNSSREYITQKNYPLKLKKDIESLKEHILQLDISEHLGNKNKYYDFVTKNGKTVSLKTNINGGKICPQIVGQVSLQKFNERTKNNLQTTKDYKALVLSDTTQIVNMYLTHLFCCEHLLSFKFDQGKLYHFHKTGKMQVILNDSHNIIFRPSKDLTTWNNSMSLSIMIKGEYRQLCEFQVHGSRNCIQCRFNLDTIISLVNNDMIKNITLESFDLKYKYNIKVLKTKFDEMEVEFDGINEHSMEIEGLQITPKKRKL